MLRSRILLPLVAALAAVSLANGADEKPALPPTPGLTALAAENTPLKAGTKIAIFGDSITMQGGYIKMIKTALAESPATKSLKTEFLAHGLNGGRVPTVLAGKSTWGNLEGTMQEWVDKEKPGVLVVFLGVNDVSHGADSTKPEEFRDGLKKMVAMGKAVNAKLVLVTPACHGEKPDGSNAYDKQLDAFSQIVREVATEANAALADARSAFIAYLKIHNVKDEAGKYKRDKILTYDGIHMSAAGNAILADTISQALVDALKAK